MFNIPYETEREGQIEFFDNYGIDWRNDDEILVNNTDGIFNGNIMEFKLSISNLNKVLFQVIKYLSRMRIKGESIPATILLIDLNNQKVYTYKSSDYKEDIQKVYIGAASKDNEGFIAETPDNIFAYSDVVQSNEVKKVLKEVKPISELYMPIDIDENCIVGWAERYYREVPTASKGDFLGDDMGTSVKVKGEIRNPRHFEGLITPYTGKSNEKFKYLMDCLNDKLSKKDLGAFYTPEPYCKKAAELVQMAVDRVPDGNDYIILDRCAGTGNLEAALIGLKDRNDEELIKHCIVSTYEYYEYKVLNERLGSFVRDIIPPTEADVKYENGKVANADAMSEEFINNPIIKKYVEDERCTIILFENPPYHDESSGVTNGKTERTGKNKSFVLSEMKKEIKGVATNELANQFIWSGFKYYMRGNSDCYIVFSPIKYWKQYTFINCMPIEFFGFNRKYFHASESVISCILWTNKKTDTNEIALKMFDIIDNKVIKVEDVIAKKVLNTTSKLYSHIDFANSDIIKTTCNKNGDENLDKKARVKSYCNESIIGYLEADSFQIAPLIRNLTRLCLYNGNGCYLSKDNYINLLPIWAAKYIPIENWYEKDVYATTSDGGDAYTKDKDFLKSCLIYTCLSNQNKCLTFDGSDGRHYQNELCFDVDTLASKDLAKMELDADEKDLIKLWNTVLKEAKETKEYNKEFTYGVYQIVKELNTSHTVIAGKKKTIIYDYPQLNGDLETLRIKLKAYYKSHITDKMFEYELIK